ncbi:ABC transporter permease [Solimonas marina]|uniref:FtsX-like permease family protein n=1 Tax=Solimonas marina TaxID=2714601 RepID=A0A969WGT9_9GAMM|nr:ABC transporter permease [Solimonas marina]NKF24420.1 FtsX-like permease family protein [Solimonas marina]
MSTNLQAALRALLQNKLQALLTLCGMSVGVAMVVIVSGLGRGAQLTIEDQIQRAGPTLIVVRSGNFQPIAQFTRGQQDTSGGGSAESSASSNGMDEGAFDVEAANRAGPKREVGKRWTQSKVPATPLSDAELHMMQHDVPNVLAVAGSIDGNLSVDPSSRAAVRVVHVEGFAPAWPDMHNWHLVAGRMVSDPEHASAAPVAMVTAAAGKRLWPDATSPLGQTLQLGGKTITVVGVIARSGDDSGNALVVPHVEVPLTLSKVLLKRDDYDSITVRTASVAVTSKVANEIIAQLRDLHQLSDETIDDFRVESQSTSALPGMGVNPLMSRAIHSNVFELEKASWEEMAKSMRQAGRTFALLLAAAAAVSLVVGGIGVMNIMLVSVTARTREIGLRMAVGARTRDVLTQFMVEAVALAAIGGVVGLGLGAAGLYLAHHGFHWATSISPGMLFVAILMAMLTGVVFGYGPARRAAVLDPVVALRKE